LSSRDPKKSRRTVGLGGTFQTEFAGHDLRGDDLRRLLGTGDRLAFGADRARSKLDSGGFSNDSPPPYGVSPCGHGTFVPVQTTYKPSVVLLIWILDFGFLKEARREELACGGRSEVGALRPARRSLERSLGDHALPFL